MAESTPTVPPCPVCNHPSAPGYILRAAANEAPVTDCPHMRLLAHHTRKHAAGWAAR